MAQRCYLIQFLNICTMRTSHECPGSFLSCLNICTIQIGGSNPAGAPQSCPLNTKTHDDQKQPRFRNITPIFITTKQAICHHPVNAARCTLASSYACLPAGPRLAPVALGLAQQLCCAAIAAQLCVTGDLTRRAVAGSDKAWSTCCSIGYGWYMGPSLFAPCHPKCLTG